jgi:hypothetical protein
VRGTRGSVLVFILALSNMERLAEQGRGRRFSAQKCEARLSLIAGYVVDRVRFHKKRKQPPSAALPARGLIRRAEAVLISRTAILA